MEENTEITDKKLTKPWQFQKGDDPRRNLAGRPQGSLDFKTKFEIFLDKLAKQNNMSPQEIDEQLFAVAYKKAKEGDYQFWKDVHDRVYGKPIQRSELTGKDGKDLIPSKEYKEEVDSLISQHLHATNTGNTK